MQDNPGEKSFSEQERSGLDKLPRQQVAAVVVTGAFDVLHPGHVGFLIWAARGRPFYVGVEDDERVRH